MGLGTRHGRGGARHHRRAHRPHHHARTNHRNHRRPRVVHHSNTHAHHNGQWLWSAAARRWAHERSAGASGTNSSSTNGPSSNSETYISFYAQTNEHSASSKAQCFSMCRVLSIFLWFAGIMLMSLGGFQTPAGFIGIGCLVCGIGFLSLTSMLSSGACSNLIHERRSGEQQRHSNPRTRSSNRNSGVVPREPAGYIPNADLAPSYASTDQSEEDKPPSYEEVTRGTYPPTISATILSTVPEDSTESLPNHGVNDLSQLPYPISSADVRYVPPTQGVNSNDSSRLPYPTRATDGDTMPPPYYTSESEHSQRAPVLPYTVSMFTPPVQVTPANTTPPPQPHPVTVTGLSVIHPLPQTSMRDARMGVSTIDGDSEYYYDDNSSVDSMNIIGSSSANGGCVHIPAARTDRSVHANAIGESSANGTHRDSPYRSRSNSDHVVRIEAEQQNDENMNNSILSRLSATEYPRSRSMEVIYQSEC